MASKRQSSLSAFGFGTKDKSTEVTASKLQKTDDTTLKNEVATTSKVVDESSKRSFVLKWLSEFPWVRFDKQSNKMFCSVCESAPSMAGKTDFVLTGCTSFKKESLTIHSKSKRHCSIRDDIIESKNRGSTVKQTFVRQTNKRDEKTMHDMKVKFITALTIAKEELPFTKFKPLLEMQKRNGVQIQDDYCNDMKCAEMISCINEEMKENLANELRDSMYYSLIIDAGTDSGVKENEAMNVRFIDCKTGLQSTKLLGLVELEHAYADGTVQAINKALTSAEFPVVENHLIGFCADGASVNFGKTGGVQKKLTDMVNWLIPIWCLPHRLELAVMGMLKKSPQADLVLEKLHLIYKTYHYSPKSRRELKALAEDLQVSVRQPSRVKGTRWSPHFERALAIILKPSEDNIENPGQYAVIVQHMEHLANSSNNTDIKGRAKNVSGKMQEIEFLAFCHFLLDLLGIIKRLSLTFQSNKTILPMAINMIKSSISEIEALNLQARIDGYLYKFFAMMALQKDHESELRFQGIPLKKHASYTTEQLDGLNMDNMSLNFRNAVRKAVTLVVGGMNDRYRSLILNHNFDHADASPSKAVSSLNVFNPDKWPDDRIELIDYGQDEIMFLVEWFREILERIMVVSVAKS